MAYSACPCLNVIIVISLLLSESTRLAELRISPCIFAPMTLYVQIGWVFGPICMVLFSAITWYCASLLADLYRVGDPITGKLKLSCT